MTTWKAPSNGERKHFDPHPTGTFAAVCCDVFEIEADNPWYNTKSKFTGEIDTRKTLRKVCVAFMTSHQVDVDGTMKPAYSSFWATAGWHEKGKLRGFVSKWNAKLGALSEVDPETLVGMEAMVSVVHYTKRDGSTGHSVDAALPLPAAMKAAVPVVPADWQRRKDRPAKDAVDAAPVTNDPKASYAAPKVERGEDEADLPF